MQYLYIHEVLKLLIDQCKNNPKIFISFFSKSDSLVGFNFDCRLKKFTHLSSSFQSVIGYKASNMLKNDDIISKIIHPHDKAILIDYLFDDSEKLNKTDSDTQPIVKKLKCRANHIKGYWKYLIFFSMNYFERDTGYVNKIGLMADEYFQPEDQVMTKNIDHFNWDDITFRKSAFQYTSSEIQISPRESEILELIGEGKIAKEIASKLNISPNTVITHRKNLISKFRVRNTAQLIKKASQLMLI